MAIIDTGAAGIISAATAGSNSGGPTGLYLLGSQLQLCGYQMIRRGTGTAGSLISGGAAFTIADCQAFNSWIQMQEPGASGRQFLWQNVQNGSAYQTHMYVSPRLGFITGAPSATARPTAADEQTVTGGVHTLWNALNNQQLRFHFIGSTTAINGIYPFVLHSYRLGTTTQDGLVFYDGLLAASADTSDPEPCCYYAGNTWGSLSLKFFTGFGTGSQAFTSMTAATSQLSFDGAHAVDPTSNKDVIGRFQIYSATIFKGYSNWFRLKSQARAYPNNVNKATEAYTYTGGASAGILVRSPDNVDLAL